MGQAGVGVASPVGAEAALSNPAALGGRELGSLFAGYVLQRASFEAFPPLYWDTNRDGMVDENDEPLVYEPDDTPADGVQVGLAVPIGDRVGLGLVAFLPRGRLLEIGANEPSLPSYFQYGRRLRRFELAAGLGVETLRGLRVGVGAQIIAEADVDVALDLDLAIQGAEEGDDSMVDLVGDTVLDVHEISLDISPRLVPVVGLQWEAGPLIPALDGLALGLTWRGSAGLPVEVSFDLQANATVTDMGEMQPLTFALVAPVTIAFLDHAIPSRLSFGASYDFRDRVGAALDVTRTAWDRVLPSVVNVTEGRVESPLFQPENAEISDGNRYTITLVPTTGIKLGLRGAPLDLDLDGRLKSLRLELRAGWAYEPSPLDAQGAGTAFLDADRMVGAAGIGVQHGDPTGLVAGPVSWDLFFQGHLLASGSFSPPESEPYRPGAPVDGAPIPVGGRLWAAGLQWSLDY